jgi:hypothetical protein
MKILIAVCLAGILAGCAEAPVRLAKEDATQLQTVSAGGLCHAYRWIGQQKLIDELKRRKAYSEEDLVSLEAHSLRVGMLESAALCVRGDAYIEYTANQDPGVKKWSYWDTRGGYIYIKDGVVASFSN